MMTNDSTMVPWKIRDVGLGLLLIVAVVVILAIVGGGLMFIGVKTGITVVADDGPRVRDGGGNAVVRPNQA